MNFFQAAVSSVPVLFRGALNPELGIVGGDPDPDHYLYRSLTETKRDLSETRRTRTNSVSYWLYLTNPWAKRALEVLIDFVIGSGVKLNATAENENDRLATQEILDYTWEGHPHNFAQKLDDYLLPLHLFGELALPFEVQKPGGKLNFGYVDPDNIEGILLNPDAMSVKSVAFKGMAKNWRVVNNCEDDMDSGTFLFQINKVVNAARGNGILTSVTDLMASLDDMMFSQLERMMLMNNFIWDVTIQGASKERLTEFHRSNSKPRPGSVRAHNEKITWAAVSPDIKAANVAHIFKLFFNMISVGVGIPEHWMGAFGADITRATAAEMNIPPLRRMERRQQYIHDSFQLVLDFALARAKKHNAQVDKGSFEKVKDTSYELDFPEVSAKNLIDLMGSLKILSESLAVAVANRWTSSENAKTVWENFIRTDLGMNLPEQEIEEPEDEDELEGSYEEVLANIA